MTEAKLKLRQWKFKACDEHEWLPAKVPGCVHTDLLRNVKISHPFYGTNERGLQWIDKQDWEYESVFDVDEQTFSQSNVEIVFDGLDTYADVYLNGHHVLSADNMFRTWKADVKDKLQRRNNTLKVRFRSPIQEDLPKLEKLDYALPASNDQSETGGLGDKRVSIFARKAPYHYGWDWGPRFVTSGIWREARLEGWSGVRITDVYIHQKSVTKQSAQLTAVIEIEADNGWEGLLRLSTDGRQWEKKVRLAAGTNKIELDAEIEQPKLWWSRGLGEQHLYEFTASLRVGNETAAQKSVKTGLRSIKLVREKDEHGTSFYFELNGIPVFAKGANHIPNDSFVTEVTYERYRHEIESAVRSNMNMLRIWGGGIYENKEFYELCDEYGILVWQDFMFACSMYPGDEHFLENVRIEAEENVKRLRNHPCIALWCGNNEIDTAWSHYNEEAGWGWKKQYTPEQREKIWADYEAIFHRILPDAVSKNDPTADYWPSSPMQALTGDINQHAGNQTTSGDIHYWGVWHAVEPFENYNIYLGRFMSEYGFQSFPEEKTVRSYAEQSEMELLSEVMLCHQRHPSGNRLIKKYMDMYLKEPKDFPSFLYMSQVLQAEAMKTAIEAHRRRKPFCMGTLYWQMNDCWPVASWSSMDYYGRWKAIQYYAKASFRDVMVSFDGTNEGRIDIHIVSDSLAPVDGKLHLKLFDFKGSLLQEQTYTVQIKANTAEKVVSLQTEQLLDGCDPNSVVLLALLEQAGEIVESKEHYFVSSKDIKLLTPAITVSEEAGSDSTRFTLETDVLAKQVWISAEVEGIFTDNYFDLIPGIPKTVQFLSRQDGGNAGFVPSSPGKLTVRSMADFVV
ncbi:beta-mannosidase [Paenibacillus alkalitolerans]|uniref:beta-mannosidase n=1 Tax=Paenibacillus alkalitolerans TaxID=2799335 RepID=UPI0018F5539D|nr:glycoside hydrolase family 2 protein [Paenibacillus alkalitolerans]